MYIINPFMRYDISKCHYYFISVLIHVKNINIFPKLHPYIYMKITNILNIFDLVWYYISKHIFFRTGTLI